LPDKIRERLLDPTRQSVYLRADESVPFGTIATVMDRLKVAGVENISVVTQPLETSKK
jgi:biopolymer transport protein ExbD/biopolymer transport protein TolR